MKISKFSKYYINLGKRKDRMIEMENYKKKIPILFDLQRVGAVDGHSIKDLEQLPYGVTLTSPQKINIKNKGSCIGGMLTHGGLGCALSHRSILEIIIRKKHEHTMVFEDDILFTTAFMEKIEKIELPDDYDVFYLGYHSAPNSVKYNEHLNKCHRIYGTFAMIISLQGAKKIVNELKLFSPLSYTIDTALYFKIPKEIINKYCVKNRKEFIIHNYPDEKNPSNINFLCSKKNVYY